MSSSSLGNNKKGRTGDSSMFTRNVRQLAIASGLKSGLGTKPLKTLYGSAAMSDVAAGDAANLVLANLVNNNSGVTTAPIVSVTDGFYIVGQYTSTSQVSLPNADGTSSGLTLPISSGGGTTSDAFIVKYNSNGTVQWATQISGTGTDSGRSVALDSQGNLYVTGQYTSTSQVSLPNADGTSSGLTLPISNSVDVFIVKYNSAGMVQWATQISGTGNDIVSSITVDSQGNLYTTGQYTSTSQVNLPSADGTLSGLTLPISKGFDAYIVKYNSNGTVQWATQISGIGTGTDSGRSINLDSQGNLYVTGQYRSTSQVSLPNADGTSSGVRLPDSNSADVFIVKYNSAGTVQWATQISRTGNDSGRSIALDSQGNLYVTGQYASTSQFSLSNADGTSSGVTLPISSSDGTTSDAFIVKYNSAGSVVWATQISGIGVNVDISIGLDSQGNLYVTGEYTLTSQVNLPSADGTLSGVTLPISTGNDAFIVKYNSDGTVQWATQISGTGTDSGLSVTLDSQGNLYTTGQYTSTSQVNLPSADGTLSGLTLPISSGGGTTSDTFIVKYNSNGTVQWATWISGTGGDNGRGIIAYGGF